MKFTTFKHLKSQFHVLFIQGFLKDSSDWNKTTNGKYINIEQETQKIASTTLITFENGDYLLEINKICQLIWDYLLPCLINKKLIIASHSYGSFYSYGLANIYPKKITAMILLDPSIKDQYYYDYLAEKINLECDDEEIKKIYQYKLENYDNIAIIPIITNNIIVNVHLNVNTKKEIDYMYRHFSKLEYFGKLTNKNIKSNISVHVNSSHMIHYKHPLEIILIISSLI